MKRYDKLKARLLKMKGVEKHYVDFYLSTLPKREDFKGLTDEDIQAYYDEFPEWYKSMKDMDEARKRYESLPEEIKQKMAQDEDEYCAIMEGHRKAGTICYACDEDD